MSYEGKCSVDGEVTTIYAKGLCRKHYNSMRESERKKKEAAAIAIPENKEEPVFTMPEQPDRPLTEAATRVRVVWRDNIHMDVQASTVPRVIENAVLMFVDVEGTVRNFPLSHLKEYSWKLKKNG